MKFVGADPEARLTGNAWRNGGKVCHYLTGNDPARWRFAGERLLSVSIASLYPGIDLIYYATQHQLEYRLHGGSGCRCLSSSLKI